MLDRSIPFYNLILKCTDYRRQESRLPKGFSIEPYRQGYERAWAELEFAAGDFDSIEQAETYFAGTYLGEVEACQRRARFLVHESGEIAGSCIAWTDPRCGGEVSSLHWLIVKEAYRRRGCGRALCGAAMDIFQENGGFPVYIHTQPWSWEAVLLYVSMGFRIQKTDTFSKYRNQYREAMGALRPILREDQYRMLVEMSDE